MSLLNLRRSKYINQVWHLVVSATLWSIWLARNDLIFNKVRIKQSIFQELILIRINKWGSASNIMSFGHDPLWKVNPLGAINLHHHKMSTNFWRAKSEGYSFVCMVDASWQSDDRGQIKAGIGGMIKSSSGNILYCFSGPSYACSIHEAEIEAILHVIKCIKCHNILSLNRSMVICSDSTKAINAFYEGLHVSFPLLVPNFDLQNILQHSICLSYVPSIINDAADSLARDGANRPTFSYFWADHFD